MKLTKKQLTGIISETITKYLNESQITNYGFVFSRKNGFKVIAIWDKKHNESISLFAQNIQNTTKFTDADYMTFTSLTKMNEYLLKYAY